MSDNLRTLQSLYSVYEDSSLLLKLEQYAVWTIPSVFPKDNTKGYQNGNSILEHDYQSKGSELVNSLSSKLTQSLFPINQSFFRLNPSEALESQVTQAGYDNLIALETAANNRLMLNASYAQLTYAVKLLIITGNALLVRKDDRVSVYSLRNYVTKRNAFGEVQDIILREKINRKDLTPDIEQALRSANKDIDNRSDVNDYYTLYTRCELVTKETTDKTVVRSWDITQEVDGFPVSTKETYSYELCPYIPAVWSIINGDDYGRGYVEDYTGDFAKLSDISLNLNDYIIETLKITHLVNPTSTTDIDSLAESRSGDYIQGEQGAVTPYEGGDAQKVQIVSSELQLVEQRLERAFMYTANSRDAERVTAYEIQVNAQQAEATLGGVYSQLSQTLHIPLAYLLLYEVVKPVIAEVQRGNIKLGIVTGLQALSRSASNQALVLAAQQAATIVQVFSQLGKQYDIDKIVEQILQSNGIDVKSILKTPEQLQQEAQAQAQQNAEAQAQQAAQIQGSSNQLQQQQAINLAQQGG